VKLVGSALQGADQKVDKGDSDYDQQNESYVVGHRDDFIGERFRVGLPIEQHHTPEKNAA